MKVTGTASGYLVCTPTGGRRVAADLGQVWDVLARTGSYRRTDAAPASLLGPATVPPLRAALSRVVLVLDHEQLPNGIRTLDARGIGSGEVLTRLRQLADHRRSQVSYVLVADLDIDRLIDDMRAHPTRPFAVTDVLAKDDPRTNVHTHRDGSIRRLPALLAWLAALDGAGVDGSATRRDLRLRLTMPDRQSLAIDLLRGIVTRCELLLATDQLEPVADQ